jgi:hypothetical protein
MKIIFETSIGTSKLIISSHNNAIHLDDHIYYHFDTASAIKKLNDYKLNDIQLRDAKRSIRIFFNSILRKYK